MLSCVVSCVPQKKSTPLLLASITSERWFRGVHMRSRSSLKTPCFQGLYASKHLQKNRTTSYKFETNNRRSGPKGRGFESRHFDTIEALQSLRLRALIFLSTHKSTCLGLKHEKPPLSGRLMINRHHVWRYANQRLTEPAMRR